MADPYASHLPVLRALGAALPIEWVLELGAGEFSTREFLSPHSFPALKLLISNEPDPEWRWKAFMVEPGSGRHLVVNMYFEQVIADLGAYELIFIDCGTRASERVPYIQAIATSRTNAVVVIHDFEYQEYQNAAKGFEHTYIYKRELPWTAVCWNGSRPDMDRFVERMTDELQTA